MRELRLAIAQSSGALEGPEERIGWLERKLKDLSSHKVDVLVLPELFLTGYNKGKKLLEWAEANDGPYAKRISALCKEFNVAIQYGFPEKLGGKLYNSATCFDASGRCLNIHRKLILPPGFEGDHFEAGQGCNIFELGDFKVATLICYDAEFPETFRHIATQGVELVLVPTALGAQWDVVAKKLIPTRAFENGIYVAYANQAGQEGDMNYLGASCIIAPNGDELARAGQEEEIIVATLQGDAVQKAQERLPYLSDVKRIRITGMSGFEPNCE
ncbi:carbon-nitrogen hydrolase family protein [Curvivirga aplysinae]|uniref:carbon-nitrogen hydrolase family protein n=1 Tax=Curvivirga aplysinae TaxID=2529852 RepID=UPI0012BCC3B3|nr:carbon-nitrogen hydrolase family protein [Curvivirga aplysinae]MTI08556.1 carbon-nitrogen hydrolase family protein [Curvivirga aplysinae]